MTKERLIRNQVVYSQGSPVNAVYIVIKGDFESHRKLPPLEDQSQAPLKKMLGKNSKTNNILAKKFSELKDIPYQQKLVIYCTGSLIGEEDIVNRKAHSSTIKCVSTKGSLYRIDLEHFQHFKNSKESWDQILKQVVKKENMIRAN